MAENIKSIVGGTGGTSRIKVLYGNKLENPDPEKRKFEIKLEGNFRIYGDVTAMTFVNWGALKEKDLDNGFLNHAAAKALYASLPSDERNQNLAFRLSLDRAVINDAAQDINTVYEIDLGFGTGDKLAAAGIKAGDRLSIEYRGRKIVRVKNDKGEWIDHPKKFTTHDFAIGVVTTDDEQQDMSDFGNSEEEAPAAAPTTTSAPAANAEDLKIEIYALALDLWGCTDENSATVEIITHSKLPLVEANYPAILDILRKLVAEKAQSAE